MNLSFSTLLKRYNSFLRDILSSPYLTWMPRLSLFAVYFWFGALKVVGLSPADQLVESLHILTLPFIPFSTFFIFLGISECAIGVLLLIKRVTNFSVPIMVVHMIITMLPLILLPELVWESLLVPNLTGQYVLKNLVLISLGYMILKEWVSRGK